mgnify:CR=1 FL=1
MKKTLLGVLSLFLVSMTVSAQYFTQDFEGGIDYINARIGSDGAGIDSTTRVPSLININVTLMPVVSRSAQTRFSLAEYARGELIGKATREGGMP